MKIIKTTIPDILIIEPIVFSDSRGCFFESFNKRIFDEAIGRSIDFVQDNHSVSQQGVLRGLHYQIAPYAQGKLVRCIEGEVFDVAVDIRESSPTFGTWVGTILSAENRYQLWIPEGFAHGFVTISKTAQFLYKTTKYYTPQSERCIIWNDPQIGIEWPNRHELILSAKDKLGIELNRAELYYAT